MQQRRSRQQILQERAAAAAAADGNASSSSTANKDDDKRERRTRQRRHGASSSKSKQRLEQKLLPRASILVYLLSIAIYLHPLALSPAPSESPQRKWKLIHDPAPQLDELHIMSHDHHDVSPLSTTSWTEAWHNDYWGRPLSMESSHKSWRPVSIWSFRFAKGGKVGRLAAAMVGKMVAEMSERFLRTFGMGYRNGGPPRPLLEEEEEEEDGRGKAEAEGEDRGEGVGGEEEGEDRGEYETMMASELFVHRFVNVLIHAAIVQLVGSVATLLFSNHRHKRSTLQLYTRYLSQLLFAFHPVHVEAVANVANRPHILALLFNATIVDPDVPLLAAGFLYAMSLLAAETAIFQLPAIVLTMTAIRYRELLIVEKYGNGNNFLSPRRMPRGEDGDNKGDDDDETSPLSRSPISKTAIALLPRYVLLALITAAYLLYRHHNDSLSIPSGLLRPAENPFYEKVQKGEWTPLAHALNYSYVLSLHIMKSFGAELVGFSHEYGYDCIPEINNLLDRRLLLPFSMLFFLEGIVVWALFGWHHSTRRRKCTHQRQKEREDRTQRILHGLVFLSWMATLFPIAGILKVGTFVADRIVVPSSFGTCIFVGRFLATWIAGPKISSSSSGGGGGRGGATILKLGVVFYLCTVFLAKRTHHRAAQWMDSVPLLESSLVACPRSIKSNLEMSKLYSGLVPHMVDLEKALSLIRTAETTDPAYCDVHQQYAHVYFQQMKYLEFEKEMAKSLMCPYTMGQAMDNWNKYWKVVLQDGRQGVKARERYERYMKRIRAEVARAEAREERQRRDRDGGSLEAKDEL